MALPVRLALGHLVRGALQHPGWLTCVIFIPGRMALVPADTRDILTFDLARCASRDGQMIYG